MRRKPSPSLVAIGILLALAAVVTLVAAASRPALPAGQEIAHLGQHAHARALDRT